MLDAADRGPALSWRTVMVRVVGDIHRLVMLHGRERARDMIPAKERHLVDVAAEVLADEAQKLGITYSGFCLTGFPHKRLADTDVWEKHGHNVTLLVEPGRLKTGPGAATLFGVPYGARARMILIYLQTQASAAATGRYGSAARCAMDGTHGLGGGRRDGTRTAGPGA